MILVSLFIVYCWTVFVSFNFLSFWIALPWNLKFPITLSSTWVNAYWRFCGDLWLRNLYGSVPGNFGRFMKHHFVFGSKALITLFRNKISSVIFIFGINEAVPFSYRVGWCFSICLYWHGLQLDLWVHFCSHLGQI